MSQAVMHDLHTFFNPTSIAVVGASSNPDKAGYQVIKNLQRGPYKGRVFPVNPRGGEILGLSCYTSLSVIPYPIDLVLITAPAPTVPGIFDDIVNRGDAKSVVVVAAGFSETKTESGKEMEDYIVNLARQNDIRIFGPNCTGVINTEQKMDTTIEPSVELKPGKISVFSQSGAVAGSILLMLEDQPVPVGFSKWAHVGNMSDVNVIDVLEYYGQDDSTEVICVYMEGFDDGRELIDLASKLAPTKHVVVLKVGRSDLGAKAAFSHTGALAGNDEIYEAAFRKSGIIRVEDLFDMVNTTKALVSQPLPKGNRVCILTEAGGPGSMAMDLLGACPELQLAHISEAGRKKLEAILPDIALICQPDGYIDMTAAAMAEAHAEALDIVLAEEEVDAVILITVPPTFLPPMDIAHALLDYPYTHEGGKPVYTCFLAGKWVAEARALLEENGWPTFDIPEQAVRAFKHMENKASYLRQRGDSDD